MITKQRIESIIKEKSHWFFIFIPILSILLYIGTVNNGFVWDDQIVIYNNASTIKGLEGLTEIWQGNTYIEGRDIYRPISQSVHAIIWEFFPNNPLPFRLLSLFLYAVATTLVYYTLTRLFSQYNKSLLGLISILFLVLAVHTEVVANNKSIDEMLSLIFTLLSFVFLLNKRLLMQTLSLILLGAGILAKISAITALPMWLFLAFLPSIQSLRNVILEKLKTLDSNLWISNVILALAFSLYLMEWYTIPVLILSMLAMPFIPFIKNRQLKFVLFLLFTFLMGIHDRWGIAVGLYMLLFNEDIRKEKPSSFELVLKYGLFTLTSILADQNSPHTAIFLGILFTLFFLYQKRNKHVVKYMPYLLGIICFLTIYSGFSEGIHSVKPISFFIALLVFLSTLGYRKSIKLKIALILIAFVLNEFMVFHKDYTLPDLSYQTINVKETTPLAINQINPYHNILIASKDKYEKAATICRIQLVYLQKLIFPTALVHQYGTRQIEFASWKDWDVYLSILIHLFLLWLAYYFHKQKYYIAMWGILWYFLTMSIYTNIIRLMPDTLAERFLFTPSIGFSAAFVSGLYYFIYRWQKTEKKSLITLGIILLPLFIYHAYKTVDRNQDWKNNYTLAANTLPNAPNNAAINAQYALELNKLIRSGVIANIDSAQALVVKHYKRAIEIYPDFYGPNNDLASHFIFKAQPDSAFPYLLEAHRLEPDFWEHHYYLALIYYDRSKYTEAFTFFDKIIQNEELQADKATFPELLEAYEFSGKCLHNLGRDQEAYAYLQQGVEAYQQRSTYILLAYFYRITGKKDLAIATFQSLLMRYPNDQEIINTIEYLEKGLIY